MKIFDFNIHLPFIHDENVNVIIDQDLNLDANGIEQGLNKHAGDFKKVDGANFLLFNTKLFDSDTIAVMEKIKSYNPAFYTTALIDFRRVDIEKYLYRLKDAGVKCIMFNSYLQQINDESFSEICRVCTIAEELGLIICVDGSYGTSKMFVYQNMKLACLLADGIAKVPIVIIHSGGYNIMQAMLLALDKPNVWLDTSFSLPYYIGSSIEQDFAFAYKKMNYKRIVFGSDHPYMQMQETIDAHKTFFEKFNFPSSAIDDIFYNNACLLFNHSV